MLQKYSKNIDKKIRDIQDEEGRDRKRKTLERKNLDIITIVKKNKTKILADISILIDK